MHFGSAITASTLSYTGLAELINEREKLLEKQKQQDLDRRIFRSHQGTTYTPKYKAYSPGWQVYLVCDEIEVISYCNMVATKRIQTECVTISHQVKNLARNCEIIGLIDIPFTEADQKVFLTILDLIENWYARHGEPPFGDRNYFESKILTP